MKTLLIPSATLIPKEMRNRFGEIPAILYPLNGMPLIEHIYRQYKDIVDNIVLVLHKKKELAIDYVTTKGLNIKVIELDKMYDLGYTVFKGMEYICQNDSAEEVYINFADTLVFDELSSLCKDTFYCVQEKLNDTWTFFELDNAGSIKMIYDKTETTDNEEPPELSMFVGCFYICESIDFFKYLSAAIEIENRPSDSFYIAIKMYSACHSVEFSIAQEWFDVGHSENYLHARTGVQARVFNTIEIDETRGILKKTSINKDKFINEINWYLKLPNKLQYLIPRIYNYSTARENPFIEMECYGYNTLHELFLYGQLPLYRWQNIFEKLRFVIRDMGRYSVVGAEDILRSMRDIYILKTIDRLDSLRKVSEFSSFFASEIVINNKQYHSLDYYMRILPDVLEKKLLNGKNLSFSIIHGDLCFSNILLEESHGFMRVIDPRGEFGVFDIYGDVRYEIAKLLHSIEGKYDFIIEDMFKINVHNNEITYIIHHKTDGILSVFKDVFKTELKNYNDIKLIESTLFLSMIPLHNDYPNRQFAMLATGIILLDEVLKESFYE